MAASSDGTAFVTELQQIEVYKQCQKITEITADYGPNGVDVSGDRLVAVGGDVSGAHFKRIGFFRLPDPPSSVVYTIQYRTTKYTYTTGTAKH